MKKRFLLILCISSLTLLSGCNPSKNSEDDNKETTTNNYDYISLNKTTLNLKSNETFTLEVYDSNNKLINSDNLNFTSSNKDVADINDQGVISAKNNTGVSAITVSLRDDEENKVICSVYVNDESLKNENLTTKFTYQDVMQSLDTGGIPSVSNENKKTNVLVVPVNFTDFSFSDFVGNENTNQKVIDNLNILFNSSGEKETKYWESVSSYFYKSSYGRLNLNFDVMPVYESNVKAVSLLNQNFGEIDLIKNAINSYLDDSNFDLNKYDNDKDGQIDAVWTIYSAPNMVNEPMLTNELQTFWAYCYFANNESFGNNLPTLNQYAWASYDFIYEGLSNSQEGIDAHTFIHETGHLFGLDDYYDYSGNTAPIGCLDMQDANVGDHNSWTKASLGWVDPYIYDTEVNQSETVIISKNQPLFISNNYRGTAFDEYIIFEYYSNSQLSYLDSTHDYNGYGRLPSTNGVKVYHSDARLVEVNLRQGYMQFDHYLTDSEINSFKDNKLRNTYTIGANNTPSRSFVDRDFDQISLISRKQRGGNFLTDNEASWTGADLFKENDNFDLYTYRVNTKNLSGNLNDGSSLDVNVEIVEVKEEYAILEISQK